MKSYPAGARVRLTPEASLFFGEPPCAGTVRRCRELSPRVQELTVDLDDGGVAVGVSSWFQRYEGSDAAA